MPTSAQRLASQPPTGAEAKIWQTLREPTHLWFEHMPLGEVVDHMKKHHPIEIALDSRALDEVGIGADTPITIRARGVSLESGLNRMLRSIDPTLTWTIDNETLLITTQEAANEHLQVVIYDVHHLIDSLSRGDNYPDQYPRTDFHGNYYGDYHALMSVIAHHIAPDSWEDVGGPASISEYEGSGIHALIVSQTVIVHRRIERLLLKLHQLGGHPMPVARPLRREERRSIVYAADTTPGLPVGTSIWNPRNLPMTKARRTKPTHRVQQARRTVAAPDWAQSVDYDASR